MFNKVIQLLFVMSSLTPFLLVYWVKEFSENRSINSSLIFLLISILLVITSFVIITAAKNKLESLPVNICKVSEVKNKSTIFFISLIPLFGINVYVFTFLFFLLSLILLKTTSYFNPILTIIGYRMYEVKLSTGSSYVLITKKKIDDVTKVNKVVQLTDYILVEKEDNTVLLTDEVVNKFKDQ